MFLQSKFWERAKQRECFGKGHNPKNSSNHMKFKSFWWARQDSNLQPIRYERMALTIELQAPDRVLHTREQGFKSITLDMEKRWTTPNSRLLWGKTTRNKRKQELCAAQARLSALFQSLFCPTVLDGTSFVSKSGFWARTEEIPPTGIKY